mmetsp:Transcript_18823/g.54242  ORF Transcript_18823/g.54242 Transcript_18823/m.54242 type:complete len:319 (-) Transcript_18823:838-1794(-)
MSSPHPLLSEPLAPRPVSALVGTSARPPKFMPTSTRRGARHVIASAIFLNSVTAIGALLGILVQPLDRFGWRRTEFSSMVVVATLTAVPFPASLTGTGHSAIPDILLSNDSHGTTFAMEYGLRGQRHPTITRGLAVLNRKQIPSRQVGLGVCSGKERVASGHGTHDALNRTRLDSDCGIGREARLAKEVKFLFARAGNGVCGVEAIATDGAGQTSTVVIDRLNALQLGLVTAPANVSTKVSAERVQYLTAERTNGRGRQNRLELHVDIVTIISHLLFVLLVLIIRKHQNLGRRLLVLLALLSLGQWHGRHLPVHVIVI